MQQAFLALANYFLAALMLVYNIQAFYAIRLRLDSREKKLRIAMKAEEVAVFFICYSVLFLESGRRQYFIFLILTLILILGFPMLCRQVYPKKNGLLLDLMMFLLGLGIVVLSRMDMGAAARQLSIEAAALVISLFIPEFLRAMHRLERYGFWYLLLGIVVLLLVFLLAKERLGAKIWVKFFGVSMQPFEFVKISFIFGCSAVFLRTKTLFTRMAVLALSGLHIVLMVLSNDLGGAVIFSVVFLVLLISSDGKIRWLVLAAIGGGAGCVAAYRLFERVRVRVVAWRNPFAVVDNEGYQLSQSLFAIGNGGFFGTGLMRGNPEQIPVVTTDFMFSAVCEELGAIFSLCLLCLYLNCILLLIRLIRQCTLDYYRLVFTGFAALFAVQIFLNVGGVIRMIPSTGVPLPFIGAGGSSAASMILMFMLVQGMQEKWDEGQSYKDQFVPGVLSERAGRALGYCCYGCCVLLGLLALYFTGFMCTEARRVIFNSYNRRQEKLEEQNAKGTIYDAGGNPLAFTMILDGKEIRKYPYGNLYSHVVGQMQNGTSGLEAVKEIDLLSSSVGEFSKLGYRIRGEQIPGNSLFTTLKTSWQEGLYRILKESENDKSAQKADALCVLSIEDSALLAAISLPDFAPDCPQEAGEEKAPLFNRVFYGIYPVWEATKPFQDASKAFGRVFPTPFGDVTEAEEDWYISPVALSMYAAAVTQKGTIGTPYVARELVDARGRRLYQNEPKSIKLAVDDSIFWYTEKSDENPQLSYRYVYSLVPSGRVGYSHALVMALFPADSPKVAVGMVMEEGKSFYLEEEIKNRLEAFCEVFASE